jgi:hypothetical protein
MTKTRAYHIAFAVIFVIFAGNTALLVLGLVWGVDPMVSTSVVVFVTSIVWSLLPLGIIDELDLPDPKGERRAEERELELAALHALKVELKPLVAEHDWYAESVMRSLKSRAKEPGGHYKPEWWDW